MVFYICFYIHSYIFVGGFKHFFFKFGFGKPWMYETSQSFILQSHAPCGGITYLLGEDEAVLMSKGFNWEPLGFE